MAIFTDLAHPDGIVTHRTLALQMKARFDHAEFVQRCRRGGMPCNVGEKISNREKLAVIPCIEEVFQNGKHIGYRLKSESTVRCFRGTFDVLSCILEWRVRFFYFFF